ncbi:hypothetical protein Rhe02_91770 [Rhizocola hellebori]|uniref:GrpB family protein n=1 Tax=Rhizocola hellebori TaxID=1392758 RepID=A0A8J3VLR5_9ACTN|nr:GrpB family protein [Rhizocola hellebori]GIH11110.1 hypothetical protein Rhe02_91770 [Rhizocola hellebori]
MSNRALVVAADPGWAAAGKALAAQLRETLGPLAVRVEHIGSTAIPGMRAKDLLDMQVSVADLDEAAQGFTAPLAALGFTRSRYEHDHVPAGSGDDPQRWRKRLFTRRGPEAAEVNLHVRLAGSPNERLALLFRDFLRAHPDAVAAYGEFKTVLAAKVPDMASYIDVKDPVVDLVFAWAQSWAEQTGWSA